MVGSMRSFKPLEGADSFQQKISGTGETYIYGIGVTDNDWNTSSPDAPEQGMRIGSVASQHQAKLRTCVLFEPLLSIRLTETDNRIWKVSDVRILYDPISEYGRVIDKFVVL